jgi:CHAD domain-containing protein
MSASRKYRFRDGHPLAAEIRRAATGRADHALQQLHEELHRDTGEAIHTARKDLKKLRSLLRLVRPALDDFSVLNEQLREAGRALGGIRDADVMLEALEDVLAGREDLIEAGSAVEAREHLLDRRTRAKHGAGPDRAAAEAIGRIESAAERFGEWPDSVARAVVPGLAREYRRGRGRWREAADDPTTERLHEWRKRAKDHWYHLLLIEDAWPEPLAARAGEVHRLTDLLGDDHDLAILAEEIAGMGPSSSDRDDLVVAIARRRGELEREAFELGARVYAEKPKAHARRMGALIDAWQGAAAYA